LTLLSPKHIDVVKRLVGRRGSVGTSLDLLSGIRELKGADDGLYLERWEESRRLLEAEGVRYGIIYVVHRRSLLELPKLYRQIRSLYPQAGLRFNPLYRQGRAGEARVWDDLGITAEEWGEALTTLYETWTGDGRPANVQPFGPWWQLSQGGRWRLSCECSGRCVLGHFGVDPGGGVYLCGRSADGGTFRFGDAADLTAESLRDHPLRRGLSNRIVYLRRTFCRGCPYWIFCHGGCVNDSVLEQGTPYAPTSLCRGLKAFFERAFGGCGERLGAGGKEREGWAA
jgi:radical SAM protein with 4Fe4S-binding SPASM domain